MPLAWAEIEGHRFREMHREGLFVQGGEWLREIQTQASGLTEAGRPPEDRPVPPAWLAGVCCIKAVPRDGVQLTVRQSTSSAERLAEIGTVRTGSQEQSL